MWLLLLNKGIVKTCSYSFISKTIAGFDVFAESDYWYLYNNTKTDLSFNITGKTFLGVFVITPNLSKIFNNFPWLVIVWPVLDFEG